MLQGVPGLQDDLIAQLEQEIDDAKHVDPSEIANAHSPLQVPPSSACDLPPAIVLKCI